MWGNSHRTSTLKAFDILRSLGNSSWETHKLTIAEKNVDTDNLLDLEFVDVEGGVGSGGRDDPHTSEWLAIDDEAHYTESGKILSGYNHFIDIKKGTGIYDDFDGYSYARGSASRGQYQDATNALSSEWGGILGQVVDDIPSPKVDAALMWWFNDEYVHAPGQQWYRENCSPSVRRYSFFRDKGVYTSVETEARSRFPLAQSTGATGMGIPYSVFMPVDNLARYWYTQYQTSHNPAHLGPVLHAIQDASIPQHAAGYSGNWHSKYEGDVNSRMSAWLASATFSTSVAGLLNQWNHPDSSPPAALPLTAALRVPANNWRIDFLVTWMALQAFKSYRDVYRHFTAGYTFNEANARRLTVQATAMCARVMRGLSAPTADPCQAIIDSMAPIQARIRMARYKLAKILTPAQQENWESVLTEAMEELRPIQEQLNTCRAQHPR